MKTNLAGEMFDLILCIVVPSWPGNKHDCERLRTCSCLNLQMSSSCSQQNSVAVFRELCGVSVVANLMQCVLALGSRVSGPDGVPLLLFDLRDHYPTLEPQGPLPDVLRRVVSTYDMVRKEELTVDMMCVSEAHIAEIHQKEGTNNLPSPVLLT